MGEHGVLDLVLWWGLQSRGGRKEVANAYDKDSRACKTKGLQTV